MLRPPNCGGCRNRHCEEHNTAGGSKRAKRRSRVALGLLPVQAWSACMGKSREKNFKKMLTLYRIRDILYIVGNEYDKQKNEGGNKND